MDLSTVAIFVSSSQEHYSRNVSYSLFSISDVSLMGRSQLFRYDKTSWILDLIESNIAISWKNNVVLSFPSRIWQRSTADVFAMFELLINRTFPFIEFTFEIENNIQLPLLDVIVVLTG